MSFELSLECCGLRLPSLALEVIEQQQKDRSVHQAVAAVADVAVCTEVVCGLKGLVQVPVPDVVRNETFITARYPVHGPIRGDDMRVVICPVHSLGRGLVPAGPCCPIETRIVREGRKRCGIVVEQAFLDTVLARTFAVLQISPQNAINKLLEFLYFVFPRLPEFLHRSREPRTRAPFIPESRNPGAGILENDAVIAAIVGHDGWTTVEG